MQQHHLPYGIYLKSYIFVMAIANWLPGIRGYNICKFCKQRTSVTLYIQKRIDGTRKFVKFGVFCGNCADGIRSGREAQSLVRKVMKIKYRLAPKIKGTGGPMWNLSQNSTFLFM